MAGKHGDQRAIADAALPDDWRLLADSPNYIVAASIPPDRDLVLRISHLGSGIVIGDGGRESTKGLVYFQGHDKPMILNKRRSGIIERLYGKSPRGWIGHWLSLYRGTDRGEGGAQVPAVAVRQKNPEPAPLNDAQQATVRELIGKVGAADTPEILEAILKPSRDPIAAMGIRAIHAVAEAVMRKRAAWEAAAAAAKEAAASSTAKEGGTDGASA